MFDNIKATDVDVVITSVPWTGTTIPLMAPSILKNIAIESGFTAVGLDLNATVLEWSKKHPYKNKLLDFFHNETYHPEITDDLFDLYQQFVNKLLEHNPKTIGLCLFSYISQSSAKYICYFIKKLAPEIRIVIGGAGCFDTLAGSTSTFAENLLSAGLIDFFIRGDGENAFKEFLKGNYSFPGINSLTWKELTKEDLEGFSYPNFDDYDFSLYELDAIPIIGSRGCVRQCKFCDYIEHWKKFEWRSGQNIFDEMLHQNQKYGIRTFKFQDSLINGNLKEYKTLIKLLAEHNQKNPDNAFSWSSFFIFRSKETFGEEWWRLTALSGAQWLNVGVESLSQEIRYHMGKHFTNDDIDFSLEMARKYNLKFIWLLIVGYVTEVEADIEFAAQWFRDHVAYKDLMKVQLGGTLGIFPNTWLDRNKEQINVIVFGPPYQKWNNTATGSTLEIRYQWNQYLFGICKELGYDLLDDIDNHYVLEMMMNEKV
jgi:hypothetical protein